MWGGYEFNGGKYYGFLVDLKNKNVSIRVLNNTSFDELKDSNLQSSFSTSIFEGLWITDQVWLYSVVVNGSAKANSKAGCYEYDFIANKLYNKSHFTINMVILNRNKRAWSEKGQHVECRNNEDSLICRATYRSLGTSLA